MKRVILVISALLITMTLLGCGSDDSDTLESTLIFSKKGAVTNVIVEPFTKDYYDVDGLRTFFNEKVNEYKTSGEKGTIALSDIEIKGGVAKATLDFDSAQTYQDFYNTELFYGTINDAYDAGYTLNITLKEVNGKETISKNDLMEMQKKKIIIVSEKIAVVSKNKIKYASANVEVIDKNNVRISSDSTGLAYLVLE